MTSRSRTSRRARKAARLERDLKQGLLFVVLVVLVLSLIVGGGGVLWLFGTSAPSEAVARPDAALSSPCATAEAASSRVRAVQ